MPTERKVETVRELADRLQRMQVAIVTDYRGLSVAEITALRRQLREKGAEFVVAKNTLTRLAAREAGKDGIEPLLEGPTALAIAYDDIPGMAKTLSNFLKESKKDIKVRGGLLGSQLIGPQDLERLATMPTREQSIAKVLGGVQAPASRIVGALNGVMRNIAYILKAYSEKEGAATSAS
ncbi:MAG: 50S ribosomal protein L10 [Herpetosiphonaceae bacterium]|nr:MAG: 50S ribosomal protein L10 [Herpetosiphonaceae bacterium]